MSPFAVAFCIARAVAGAKLIVQMSAGQVMLVPGVNVPRLTNDPIAEPVHRVKLSPICAEPTRTSVELNRTLELIATEVVPAISQSASVHAVPGPVPF